MRVVIDPKTGRPAAPKKLTYAREMVIVDGDDGKTYIAQLSFYGHITIACGDMRFEHEVIHADSPRYEALRSFFRWGGETASVQADGKLGARDVRQGD